LQKLQNFGQDLAQSGAQVHGLDGAFAFGQAPHIKKDNTMHIELLGKWKPSFSFWYSTKEESVHHLLPSGLKPQTKNGKAFWNVFFARMNQMRPAGLPVWCGIDSWLIIYSIYVSTRVEASGIVKGLYAVGTQAEPKFVSKIQSVLPGLNVQPAEINLELQGWLLNLHIKTDKLNVLEIDSNAAASTYESSYFANLSESVEFFKYRSRFLSFTDDFVEFSELTDQRQRRIVDVRGEWNFLSQMNSAPLILELATRLEPSSFYWVAGKRERLVKTPVVIPELATTH
jgi:hypothetical protein